MTAFVIRRILWLIPVLWAVATVTFLLMHAVQGGPFDSDKKLPPTVLANLNAKYNLDKPLIQQYGLFFWDLGHGDLGLSFRNERPVIDIVKEGWQVTAQLGLIAFAF